MANKESSIAVAYVRGTENSGMPVMHEQIVVGQTITAGAIANALLALFKLFQETEVPRYYRHNCAGESVCLFAISQMGEAMEQGKA